VKNNCFLLKKGLFFWRSIFLQSIFFYPLFLPLAIGSEFLKEGAEEFLIGGKRFAQDEIKMLKILFLNNQGNTN